LAQLATEMLAQFSGAFWQLLIDENVQCGNSCSSGELEKN
jgi:hypothetical protein